MGDNNKSPHKTLSDDLDTIQHDSAAPPPLPQQPPPYNMQSEGGTVDVAPITGQPGQQATTTTVLSYPPMMSSNVQVGPKSMPMTCPHCRCRINTEIRHRSTAKTHIACLLLSWTLCCCCLPYCMDTCRNTNHFCPMCGTFIGTYQS